MKWCRFQSGRTTTYGIIDDTTVTEVTGNPFESYAKTATTTQLSRVKLLVPVIPPTFYAAGVNYREHVTEMAHRRGVKPEFPPQADVGYRANNALVATDEPIVIPKDATQEVQYEGELVVVIGKRCKRISEARALDCVFGYTICWDISQRDPWGRNRQNTRNIRKGFDTFTALGPWIVTRDEIAEPQDLTIEVEHNGAKAMTAHTSDMICGLREHIRFLSGVLTLRPGDLITTGTPAGVRKLAAGDRLTGRIEKIGEMSLCVAAET